MLHGFSKQFPKGNNQKTVCDAIILYVKATSVPALLLEANIGRFFIESTNSALSGDVLSATIAIINANVKTMNLKKTTAQAIAITNNKISKVGDNSEIRPFIGENTMVMDLEGKTVIPGFIDTHIHVADYGRCLMWLDLSRTRSIAEIKQKIKEKTKQTSKGKWIIGQGWNETRLQEKRVLSIEDLDEASPDNPVILYRESAMICAVNSKALEVAHITEKTPVPLGGAIEKSASGRLNGIFKDAATTLVWQAVSEPTEGELLMGTVSACQKIFQAGITSLNWIVISEGELSIIQKLHTMGQLMFRVNVIVPEAMLQKATALKFNDDQVIRVGGAFIVVDGYLDSKEAALTQPYSDDPNNYGKLLISEEELTALVNRVLSFGVQPVIHAMGDKAIDLALSVIQKNPQVRFRIEQAAILNPNLIKQLKTQNLTITIQPKVISTEFTVWSAKERLGDRAKYLHPLKTLTDQGITVAAGSDCPMEPLNPLLGIQELITRTNYPEQRLTVQEAIKLYTFNGAYASNEESIKGSIEENKLADLVVLAENPESTDPEKIKDIKIDFVIINGRIMIPT